MKNFKRIFASVAMLIILLVITPVGASASNHNTMNHLEDYNNSWIYNNNSWIYIVDSKPVTGFQTIKGKLYYFDNEGKMLSDQWANYNNNWIYASSNGKLVGIGWKYINKKWYYFDTNGYMVHDTTIDGYVIGSDGAMK